MSNTDHFSVICKFKISTSTIHKHLSRALRSIDITNTCCDVPSSELINQPVATLPFCVPVEHINDYLFIDKSKLQNDMSDYRVN